MQTITTMTSTKKILIIAGGGRKHMEPFRVAAGKLKVNVKLASFSQMEYLSKDTMPELLIDGEPLDNFSVIYIRLVGKRFEDAALLVAEAKKKGIRVVDRIYEKSEYTRLPLAKSLETKLLIENNIPTPKTYFASLKKIRNRGYQIFGFPFVIKGTIGKQGHAVWSPKNKEELNELHESLREKEKMGARFLAQEFIKASQRERILVIGEKAVAEITRPTRWRRRFLKKDEKGDVKQGIKKGIAPVPKEDADIAVKASKSLGIEVGGVDLIREDETGNPYILEVNSAPRWESIKKDTEVEVEKEIIKYLLTLGYNSS